MVANRDRPAHLISHSQESYINNLLKRFKLQGVTTVTTLLAPGVVLTRDQCPATAEGQRKKLIGSLQYVALATTRHQLRYYQTRAVPYQPQPCTLTGRPARLTIS